MFSDDEDDLPDDAVHAWPAVSKLGSQVRACVRERACCVVA
jgi:hypothetical protein